MRVLYVENWLQLAHTIKVAPLDFLVVIPWVSFNVKYTTIRNRTGHATTTPFVAIDQSLSWSGFGCNRGYRSNAMTPLLFLHIVEFLEFWSFYSTQFTLLYLVHMAAFLRTKFKKNLSERFWEICNFFGLKNERNSFEPP